MHRNLGDGTLGYLVLTEPPSTHNLILILLLVAPVNMGPILAMSDPAPREIFILELVRNHVEDLRVWQEYNDVDRVIKQVIKTIVTKVYFQTLCNRPTGYDTVGSLDNLTHLQATYGIPEDEYIQAIDMALETPINVEKNFREFFSHIKDNQEAVVTKNPYTNEQIISIANNLVFKVGFYSLKCKEWRSKATVDKTWNNFKVNFD